MAQIDSTSPYLLHSGDHPSLLLLCDHAGNRVPAELAGLGMDQGALRRHIAWDPGALGVALALARRLDAPLLGCLDSRLLADPNRAPDHPELILAQSDGVFVPANERLDEAAREARLERFHRPYHAAIAAAVAARRQAGLQPFLLSIHSFEPVFAGVPRPWPVGVLWKQDERFAAPLIAALEQEVMPVGNNQPYDGRVALGHTLEAHAIAHGLPHLLVEIRNDGILDAAGQALWADRLFIALHGALPALMR